MNLPRERCLGDRARRGLAPKPRVVAARPDALRDEVEYRDLGPTISTVRTIGRLVRRLGDLGCELEIKSVAA